MIKPGQVIQVSSRQVRSGKASWSAPVFLSDQVDQYSLGQLGPVMSVRLAQISQLGQIGSGKVRSVSSSRSGQIR